MAATFVPVDGRITSLQSAGTLLGDEVFEVVQPGNAAKGNSFQVTLLTIAGFFVTNPFLNSAVVITSGATLASPYLVQSLDTRILFNKTVGAASYATCPLASAMTYKNGIFFKDLKGDADTNPITINFTSGQLCDGLSDVTITVPYGYIEIFPTPAGTAWYIARTT